MPEERKKRETFPAVDCRIIIAVTGSGHWWATGSTDFEDDGAIECATDFAISEAKDAGIDEEEAARTVQCFAAAVRIPERLKHLVNGELQLTTGESLKPSKPDGEPPEDT